jgi:hypothetical protein
MSIESFHAAASHTAAGQQTKWDQDITMMILSNESKSQRTRQSALYRLAKQRGFGPMKCRSRIPSDIQYGHCHIKSSSSLYASVKREDADLNQEQRKYQECNYHPFAAGSLANSIT